MTPRGSGTIVFVQARMGSTRFAGKVLQGVLGKPILIHQIERIRRARTIGEVAVITSTLSRDDVLAELGKRYDIPVFRGSETDLLDRHYQAARKFGADLVVKIPSDCPLADPDLIDEVIRLSKSAAGYDYVSNYHPPTFPDGLDVEVSPFGVIEAAWGEATKPHEREHTFPFIWDQPERFRIGNIVNPRGNMFMTHRWTLDYPEDWTFVSRVYEEQRDKPEFGTDDVLELLGRKPEIAKINDKYNGVNWYRNAAGELRTVGKELYRQPPT